MDQQEIVVEVRAMPAPGHKRRWCGLERWADSAKRPGPKEQRHALPWPASPVKVYVKDDPKPFDPDQEGGVPTEISPRTLEALQRDPRIAVRTISGFVEVDEVLGAKAAALEAQQKIVELQREAAAVSERLHAAKLSEETAAKLAEAREKRIAELEAEVAEMRAASSSGKRGR